MPLPKKKASKAKEPQPKKRGRPRKRIDYEVVEKLAMLMCTEEEIANYLNISTRTLQRDEEFCRIYKKGLDMGKMSLRRTQFKLAQKSSAMAIFLGKQYLGQSDDFTGSSNLKEDNKDALSVAFEEFTENGTIAEDDK